MSTGLIKPEVAQKVKVRTPSLGAGGGKKAARVGQLLRPYPDVWA